jgi:hypothetical protein
MLQLDGLVEMQGCGLVNRTQRRSEKILPLMIGWPSGLAEVPLRLAEIRPKSQSRWSFQSRQSELKTVPELPLGGWLWLLYKCQRDPS